MTLDPARLQAFARYRILLAERDDWREGRVAVLGDSVLVARARPNGDVLLALGESDDVIDLLDGEARLHHRSEAPGAMWLSAPRAVDVPPWVLDALRLAPATQWDWMSIDTMPDGDVDQRVRRLDLAPGSSDVEEARALLAVANPISTADPLGDGEVAWFAMSESAPAHGPAGEAGAAVGVIGARLAQGDPARDGSFSWHLHGLGVAPGARRAGYGAALTTAAVRAGLAAGADWVSLGLYADNDAARRIYTRIGFRLEAEMASYAPATLAR
ncbi:GNAT family N-acetyltransferase [Salana multivorans]|uniref:GNAT family N-acetyltransferase n=1 Tax=Salana multivorans TaxID=120377 RepID=UPI00248F5E57|nr:GNAT family N-acetyltransferase [Salana multivorans]